MLVADKENMEIEDGLTCAHGELTAHRFEGAEARSVGARVRRLVLAREQRHGTAGLVTGCWILGSGTSH